MLKFFLLILFSLSINLSYSQKTDYHWLIGYGGEFDPKDTDFGLNEINFDTFPALVKYISEGVADFSENAISISDSSGNLKFYTNGVAVYNTLHQKMQNGDSLTHPYDELGLQAPQNIFSIPYPGTKDSFLLIYHEWKFHWYNGYDFLNMSADLRYSIVDMTKNTGIGSVMSKHNIIVQDTLAPCFLTSCKHANGRDWWVLLWERKNNKLYHILIDPSGLNIKFIDSVDIQLDFGLGQSSFSPDGNKYAILNLITKEKLYLDIFDFDRCTGKLSNQRRLKYDPNINPYSGGLSFSHDSRYLYVSLYTEIFQYDLWVEDVFSSEKLVAVWDGAFDPYPTRFYLTQLAPDGRIYISCNNGVKSMHVIRHPDRADTLCEIQQRGLKLISYNGYSMPNYPYYRLGPDDGCPCDTLGLDNHPFANFRYDIDSSRMNRVEFTDLSDYKPNSFVWDFGDGNYSALRHPVHIYDKAGLYKVCLTASNQYSADTLCRMLRIDNAYYFYDTVSICSGESLLWQDTRYFADGDYIAEYSSVGGLDSIYHLHLTLNPNYFIRDTITLCSKDTLLWHDQYLTDPGLYYSFLTTVAGCDSTLELTVYSDYLDASIFQNADTLFTNFKSMYSYQWIDCTDLKPIPSEVSSVFVPDENGTYAVIISDGLCSDTSDCHLFIKSVINEIESDHWQIFPNPASDELWIKLPDQKYETLDISIFNQNGQIVKTYELIGPFDDVVKLHKLNFKSGIYLLKINHGKNDLKTVKIVFLNSK